MKPLRHWEVRVVKPLFVGLMLMTSLSAGRMAFAQATASGQPPRPPETAPARNDYADEKSWLCRPGRHDACDVDLRTTIVPANGKLTTENWKADPKAPIDCFYVYPTVSTDTTPNSDMTADPAELTVVKTQFARFASRCRPFAPLYRQVTLAALRRGLATGSLVPLDHGIGYDDVLDAWKYYLEHDNKGRGVVLIGHSQGSFVLMEMIRQEIDGKPIQSQLVSAILLGTTLPVPKGKDVGGVFKQIPLCHAATQTGCVMVYASFRSTIPPPGNTLFGKIGDPNLVAGCTNPAALGGGSGALHAYLSAGGTILNPAPPRQWTTPPQPVETPYVSVPGLLTSECVTNENGTYLKVTVNADPSDPRADDISGDISVGTQVAANWGLHLVDMNLGIGNFLDIVGRQAKAYASKRH